MLSGAAVWVGYSWRWQGTRRSLPAEGSSGWCTGELHLLSAFVSVFLQNKLGKLSSFFVIAYVNFLFSCDASLFMLGSDLQKCCCAAAAEVGGRCALNR